MRVPVGQFLNSIISSINTYLIMVKSLLKTLACVVPIFILSIQIVNAQLLNEGFDDISTLTGNGWTILNESEPLGVISWFQGNNAVFPAYDGNTDDYIAVNFNSTAGTGTISNWLITPVLNLINGDTIS